MNIATKTKIAKSKSHEVFVKEGDEVELVWFVHSGKVNVVKYLTINNKPKHLKIDELGAGDMFGHHDLEGSGKFDYSIITQLPTEFYGIAKTDYNNLPQDIKNNFNEYVKPYPDTTIIKQNYFDNKRWIKFQKACRENIRNDKYNSRELSNPFKTARGNVTPFINAFNMLIDRKPIPKPRIKGLLSDSRSSSGSKRSDPTDSLPTLPNTRGQVFDENTMKTTKTVPDMVRKKKVFQDKTGVKNSPKKDIPKFSFRKDNNDLVENKPNLMSHTTQGWTQKKHNNATIKIKSRMQTLKPISGQNKLKTRAKSVCRMGTEDQQNIKIENLPMPRQVRMGSVSNDIC